MLKNEHNRNNKRFGKLLTTVNQIPKWRILKKIKIKKFCFLKRSISRKSVEQISRLWKSPHFDLCSLSTNHESSIEEECNLVNSGWESLEEELSLSNPDGADEESTLNALTFLHLEVLRANKAGIYLLMLGFSF